LLLTVLLRMSCHTYQGPVHMLGIGMVFLLFGESLAADFCARIA
jgi:hypothetical protein